MTTFDELKRGIYRSVACWPGNPPPPSHPGSDIVLHLPVLEYFASLCETVCEFGVRDGHSTVALISGCKGKVFSYDIERTPIVDRLFDMKLPCSTWLFRELDTGSAEDEGLVPSCDMLFVDTLHTYEHVKKELALHGRKAARFLAFHDTETCGTLDASGPDPEAKGILPAIYDFLNAYPGEYETRYWSTACSGLWILERTASR